MTQPDSHQTRPSFKDALALIQDEVARLRSVRPPMKGANQPFDEAGNQWLDELFALQDQLQKVFEGNESPENIINTIRSRQHLETPDTPTHDLDNDH
ncbi:MAG: hypothetical protein K9J06_08425 [Flavobacteriales bacterium]|nr:hypothetical protein [Flavobacteriales bacterium]